MSNENDIRREEARERLRARNGQSGRSSSSRSTRTHERSSATGRTRTTSSRERSSDSRERSGGSRSRSRSTESQRSRERGTSRSNTSGRNREGNRAASSSSPSSRRRSTSQRTAPDRGRGRTGTASAARTSSPSSAAGHLGATLWSAYLDLVERFQWKTIIATVVVLLLLIILVVSGIRGCVASIGSSDGDSQTASQSASAAPSEASSSAASADATSISSGQTLVAASTPVQLIASNVPEVDKTEIDEDYLVNILDTELASMLIEQAQSNNDAHWIASHPDEYLEDGTIVRYKMLRLAAKEPQAIPFVRDWPEKYCADAPNYDDEHSDEVSNGVPRLYQWDKRWGYTEYSSTTFALTGCAPTSLAMVYQAITGDTSKSPYDMGVYAVENGYATTYDGTDGSLFSWGSSGLGLSCTELAIDSWALSLALSNGQIVVVNVGPGDFTDSGHYFVATGLAEDGSVMINDPFSAVRSAQTWDIDLIISQTRALYAFA